MADDPTTGTPEAPRGPVELPDEAPTDDGLLPEEERPLSPPDKPARHGFGLVTLALMGMQLLVRLGGMIQKMVVASFYATGTMGDVAVAVEKVFSSVYFIGEELLTHSLLPVFNRARAGDEQGGEQERAAWSFASSVGGIQMLILLTLTVLGTVFTHGLCAVVLGEPSPAKSNYADELAKFETTVRIVRLSFAGLFCTSLSTLTYVLLNSYKRFVSPALGEVANKGGIIVGIVIMSVGFGNESPVGYALGFVLGGVFKLLTHLIALGPKLRLVRPKIDWHNPYLRELGLLMVPLLLGSLVGKVRDLAEVRIAWAAAEGTLASLDYARKPVMVLINVLPFALGIAMFPFLSEWARQGQKEKVTEAFDTATRNMIFLFAPITVLFLLLAPEIITVVYKSGRFGSASVDLVTAAFYVYAAGMTAYALEIISNQVFYAHRDTLRPFVIGLCTSTLHILIAWLLGLALGLGNVGIAIGYAASKTLKVIIQWVVLRPRLSGSHWPRLWKMIGAVTIACLVLGAAVALCRTAFGAIGWNLADRHLAFVFVLVAGGFGLGAYLLIAAALKVPEVDLVLAKIRGKLRRGK